MYYFLSALLNSAGSGALLLIWSLFCSIGGLVEEKEHFLFALLGVLVLFLVFPVLEGGMAKWVLLAIVIISGFFCISSPLWLYVFLELSLLPVLVLVMGWGVQPERVSAGYHLLIYTFVFSSPLLIGVLLLEGGLGLSGLIWSFLMGFAFMVKTPMYLVHVWLPKAHVEAPTAGSIILAGILLKMGGIGLIWMQAWCALPWSLFFFFCVFLGASSAAAVSGFQSDGKAFVAYSSVAHMNLGMVVVMLSSAQGDSSSSLLMLNHGLVSSSLFLLVGTCFHLLSSRLVYFFSSLFLLKSSSFLVISWVVVCNFSVPPSLGFFGEVSALSLFLSTLWGALALLCLYFLFVAYYSLFLNLSLVGSGQTKSESFPAVAAWALAALSLGDFCFWSFY